MHDLQNSLTRKNTNIIRAEFENMISARGTSILRFDTNAGINSGEYIEKGIQREWVGYFLNHTSSGHSVKAFEPVYSIPLKIRPYLQSRNVAGHQAKPKNVFESYDEAYLTAAIDSEEYCKPFWVYQNSVDGHYSVSTRGYTNVNAPASIPSDNRIDIAQIKMGYPMLDYCYNIIPSSVLRLGFNGRVFIQGKYYYTNEEVFSWLSRNPDSAVFITFPKVNQTDRAELMSIMKRECLHSWGLFSYYRWLGRSTALLALSPVSSNASVKLRSSNAHFFKNAMLADNTIIPKGNKILSPE